MGFLFFIYFLYKAFLVENSANIVYIFHPQRMYERAQLEDILEALKTNRLIRMPFQDDGGRWTVDDPGQRLGDANG